MEGEGGVGEKGAGGGWGRVRAGVNGVRKAMLCRQRCCVDRVL